MPLAWLTRVVTSQSRIRWGCQKRQVPACGALPRRFVFPRDRVWHSLSVGSEKPRWVPAFGTRVWPDVTARHFALLVCFLGRVPRTTQLYKCRATYPPRLSYAPAARARLGTLRAALESGEWLMSTCRCAANGAVRRWISPIQVPGKPGSPISSGSAWNAAATFGPRIPSRKRPMPSSGPMA